MSPETSIPVPAAMTPADGQVQPILGRLDRLRGMLRRLYLVDGVSRILLTGAAFVAVTFVIDWSLRLPAPVRLIALGVGLLILGRTFLRRVLYALRVRLSDDDLALIVERRYPELEDRLISAVQLGRGTDAASSGELVASVVEEAGRAVASLDLGRVIVRRRVRRRTMAAVIATHVLVALGALFPAYGDAYWNRVFGGDAKWPQRTRLRVLDFTDGRRVIARGDDLPVVVEYEGAEPSKAVLEYRFDTGESARQRMSPLANRRFQFVFTRVSGPVEFTVEAGDDLTLPQRVLTLTPPGLESIGIFYEYPAYLKKENTPPDRPEIGGNVTAPMHTKVRVQALANEDLQEASLTVVFGERKTVLPLALDEKLRGVTGSFEVTEAAGEYSLQLTARNGLAPRDPLRYAIRGVEDHPPDIVVRDPLGDEVITDVCERPIEIEVRDDYGVALVALEYRALAQKTDRSRDWTVVEFSRQHNTRDYGETFIRSLYVLEAAPLGLQAGDHLEFRLRAEDYKDTGGRNVKTSRVYRLSVVAMGVLERELQDAIEKVKVVLKAQKTRQEAAWARTEQLRARADLQGEARQAALEQSDLTARLEGAARDVRTIQRRGVFNKVFNESAAAKLQGALDELEAAAGDPKDPARPGPSRAAAAGLDQAARAKDAAERSAALERAGALQSDVAERIRKALEYLDKWSSYQEVIRVAREILDRQKDVVNEGIKKIGGAK